MAIPVTKILGTRHTGESAYVASGEYTQINSYAAVTALNGNQVTIDKANALIGRFTFDTAPYWVMIHVTAKKNASVDANSCGRFLCARVTAVNGDVLTLDKSTNELSRGITPDTHFIQAVLTGKILQLRIYNSANVQPPPFDITKGYGGILFMKVSQWIRMYPGSYITAKDKGIPKEHPEYAPPDDYTRNGGLVTDKAAGWNNSAIIRDHHGTTIGYMRMPIGDGIIIVQTERLILMPNSVIGRKPEDADPNDKGTYSYSSRGSAKIWLACEEITRNTEKDNVLVQDWELGDHIINSRPDPIAGAEVGGVMFTGNVFRSNIGTRPEDLYPATNNESTYSFNLEEGLTFAKETLGIRNYLEGKLGSAKDLQENLNNYAKVIGISEDGYSIHYRDKTEDGIAKFKVGAYVLFLVSQWGTEMDQSSDNSHPEYDLIGKFKICKVLADDGYTMVLDRKPPEFRKIKQWFNDLSIQLVTIACFTDVTQTVTYNAMRPFKDGIGGVLAIACSGTLDLSDNGCLLTTWGGHDKDRGIAYGRNGLKYIGNAQCKDKLPVGQGMGSAFIMAKNLNLSRTSRIGAYMDGAWVGGYAVGRNKVIQEAGGLRGLPINGGGGGVVEGDIPTGWIAGGYGGSGKATVKQRESGTYTNVYTAFQGAHIMCIADTIQNFTISAFSTGGGSDYKHTDTLFNKSLSLASAGAGYGAGCDGINGASGGYNGGGAAEDIEHGSSGGSSGWCFVYCNHVGTFDERGLVDSNPGNNQDIFNRDQQVTMAQAPSDEPSSDDSERQQLIARGVGNIDPTWWPSAENLPPNYLLCDGSTVSRIQYSNLFKVIGTTYGTGDGRTTFNVPLLTRDIEQPDGTKIKYYNAIRY